MASFYYFYESEGIGTTMNTPVTLRDIAKALNLSASTVSRALTDSYQIGEKTKKRVLEYAKAHHYIPNRLARGLKEGKSRSIGVVVCSIDNGFAAQMLSGIDAFYTSHGYQTIIMQSKESFSQELAGIELLNSGGIDGLLISPSYQTTDFSALKKLQATGLPIVLFDRLSDEIDTHKVSANHFLGAYEATKHLIENRYSRIAHLNVNSSLKMSTERFLGYKNALMEAGIELDENLVKFLDFNHSEELEQQLNLALESLMNLENRPEAIFTATDQMSTKTLMLLKKMNFRVPEDVALIGFCNTDLANAFFTPLSTISQPAFEIGTRAAAQLLELIKGNHSGEFETELLATELQIRLSSSPKN